jgi:hypothetical protein
MGTKKLFPNQISNTIFQLHNKEYQISFLHLPLVPIHTHIQTIFLLSDLYYSTKNLINTKLLSTSTKSKTLLSILSFFSFIYSYFFPPPPPLFLIN